MFRRFSVNFAVLSIFFDLIIGAGVLYMAARLRPFFSSLPYVQSIPAYSPLPLVLYMIFPLLWVGVLLLFSVYDGRRNFRVVDEFSSLTFGSVLAGVAMAGVLYLSFREISRFLFLSYVIGGYIGMLGWRGAVRIAFRLQWMQPSAPRRVLILGAGKLGSDFARAMTARAVGNLLLVGYLDDDVEKQRRQDVFGGLADLRRVVTEQRIDEVLLALPRTANGRMEKAIAEMHNLPVRVWVVLDYLSLSLHRATVEEFAGIPMLDLRAPALNEYQRIIKRAFDLSVCLLMLPFLLPVYALAALAIRLDDGGPVLYHTSRAGENGRVFRMHKFRTMHVDAEKLQSKVSHHDENGQILHKSPDDPRVTRVGRFLRRSSLDELPQLFNVIKGEMSLVGPRPEMPYLVEKYDLWQRKRFAVPQGITGWWQVNGRADKPMHLHTEEDLYYIQHYSLWLDLQILLKTIWAVLRGRGAF